MHQYCGFSEQKIAALKYTIFHILDLVNTVAKAKMFAMYGWKLRTTKCSLISVDVA
jgi:hypothetical protein